MNHLQTKLEEERQLASQHQLAFQAQTNEVQARMKVCIVMYHVAVYAVQFLIIPLFLCSMFFMSVYYIIDFLLLCFSYPCSFVLLPEFIDN